MDEVLPLDIPHAESLRGLLRDGADAAVKLRRRGQNAEARAVAARVAREIDDRIPETFAYPDDDFDPRAVARNTVNRWAL